MNPELRRNLWIELTPQRLVVTPILVVMLLVFLSASDARPWPTIYTGAVVIFVLMVHFWGTRKASESVSEEVRDRTWDWQRLSSLGPWQMGLGKLFGSTAFTWYGGAICLAIMAVAAWADRDRTGAASHMVVLAGSALALHGVAVAGSLQASRKDSKLGSRIGTIMLIPLALIVTAVYLRGAGTLGTLTWYGRAYDGMAFLAASTVVFAGWAVLAVHREMSRELRLPGLPWAYPAFAVFAGAFGAGFVSPILAPRANSVAFLVFAVATGLVYYGLFADVTNVLSVRRLVLRARAGQWRRALEAIPLWATALAVAVAFGAASSAMPDAFGQRHERSWLGMTPFAMALFALRDAAVLVFFALSLRARRPEGSTLVAIALLSWLVPGLAALMGAPALATALAPFGLPVGQSIAIAALHVALAFALVAWRWRTLETAMAAPGNASAPGV